MALISFLTAILACYRLAHLLPEDDGPFFIFKRIREYVSTMAMAQNDEWGFWEMVSDGVHCVYCMGLYAAAVVAGLVVWNNYYGNVFLLLFAIAGGQSFLQKMSSK